MTINEFVKKALVWGYDYNKSRIYQKKIKTIANHLKVKNKKYNNQKLNEHITKWKKFKKNINPLWYKVYSYVLEKEDINFLPEDIYYLFIEPCLNNKQIGKAYADKNSYELLYKSGLFPETILRNMDGKFYSDNNEILDIDDEKLEKTLRHNEKIIVKPSLDSGGGHSIELFKRQKDGKFINTIDTVLTLNYLIRTFKRNFLIQLYIEQHSFFKQFNEESVNSVRIFTYRSVISDQVHVLHSLLRAGRKGSYVDNQASGGLSCGINEKGELNKFAVDKYGNKFLTVNGKSLNNKILVPFYNEMLKTAKEIACQNKYSRLLGFDFCVDTNDNIKIIEINNVNNEINFYQMNQGSLFANYTDEVIDYCLNNARSFSFDFYC
jgi:hypothetical protein